MEEGDGAVCTKPFPAGTSLRHSPAHLAPVGTGGNQSPPPCDVESEKTNEPAVLTAAFSDD